MQTTAGISVTARVASVGGGCGGGGAASGVVVTGVVVAGVVVAGVVVAALEVADVLGADVAAVVRGPAAGSAAGPHPVLSQAVVTARAR
ncbi:hypothetical protein [Nocardia wallacei]|uniref:hypothetical protein n=1 Tax=Nocardia wallacei TaxID=480035 RepID=UPI002453B21F|nr:hypothetical protein [Nocardia wallacei]